MCTTWDKQWVEFPSELVSALFGRCVRLWRLKFGRPLKPTPHPDVLLPSVPPTEPGGPVGAQFPSVFCSGGLWSTTSPGLILCLTLCVYSAPSPPPFLFPPRAGLSTVGTGNRRPSGCDAHHRPHSVSKKGVASLQPPVQQCQAPMPSILCILQEKEAFHGADFF